MFGYQGKLIDLAYGIFAFILSAWVTMVIPPIESAVWSSSLWFLVSSD